MARRARSADRAFSVARTQHNGGKALWAGCHAPDLRVCGFSNLSVAGIVLREAPRLAWGRVPALRGPRASSTLPELLC